jgi:NTP pyrophosphatase (non-canonical NTP hydrolase)
MNPKEYQIAAMRTAVLRGNQFNMEHSILGLTTEIGELVTNIKRMVIYGKVADEAMLANMKEEVGDILWYIPLGMQVVGLKFENAFWAAEFRAMSLVEATREMVAGLGHLNDFVTAEACISGFTPKSIEAITQAYGRIIAGAGSVGNFLGSSILQLCGQNIAKLRLRYPDKFTAELAEARLDKSGLGTEAS